MKTYQIDNVKITYDGYENDVIDYSKLLQVTQSPAFDRIPRKHRIIDLIRAEIAKLKLKDYEKSKKIDYVEIGGPDFLDLLAEDFPKLNIFKTEKIIIDNIPVHNLKSPDRKIKVHIKQNLFSGDIPITFDNKAFYHLYQQYMENFIQNENKTTIKIKLQ